MFELLLSGHVVYRFRPISLRKSKDEERARWRDEQINFAIHMLRVLVRLSAAQQCYSSCPHRKVTHSVATETVNMNKWQGSQTSIHLRPLDDKVSEELLTLGKIYTPIPFI